MGDEYDLMFIVTVDGDGNTTSVRPASFREWSSRGRVSDCDCDLLQCQCVEIRQHKPDCERRLSITSPIDFGLFDCTCGGIEP